MARRMLIMQPYNTVWDERKKVLNPPSTVSYCQYGDTRMKPTDIWHNTQWVPRPICFNGAPCHDAAPRGSRTGTQGVQGARLRSVIPMALCREIAEYAAANIGELSPQRIDQAPLWSHQEL